MASFLDVMSKYLDKQAEQKETPKIPAVAPAPKKPTATPITENDTAGLPQSMAIAAAIMNSGGSGAAELNESKQEAARKISENVEGEVNQTVEDDVLHAALIAG